MFERELQHTTIEYLEMRRAEKIEKREELVWERLCRGDGNTHTRAASYVTKIQNGKRFVAAERDALIPIPRKLDQSRDYEVGEATLLSLLNLRTGIDWNKMLIEESTAIPLVMELLQCRDKEAVVIALAALFALSTRIHNERAIVASGAIRSVVGVLGKPGHRPAKTIAIAILDRLSTCKEIVDLMVSHGGVRFILRLISHSNISSELVQDSIELLEHWMSLSEVVAAEIAEKEGGILSLVEAVEEGSWKCKESAAGLLLAMCRFDRQRYSEMLMAEGPIPGLIRLGFYGSLNARVMSRELLGLLRHLSDGDDGAIPLWNRKADTVRSLMEDIDAGTIVRVEEIMAKLNA